MNQKLLILLISIFFTVHTYDYSMCEALCITCNRAALDVVACRGCLLALYNRNLTIKNQCACSDNFIQNIPQTDYCCPTTCFSCYKFGCVSCRKNWTLTYQPIRQYFNCTCRPNFQYNYLIQDCICLAQLNKIGYYQPSPFQCYSCPNGCTCDARGCFNCNSDTLRVIDISLYFISTCLCKSGLVQINGSCVQAIIISCSSPLTLVNGRCLCKQPYQLNASNICICKSLANPLYYYQNNNLCYKCPPGCKCNELGCYYCLPLAYRLVRENNCSCQLPAIQINNTCVCIFPNNPINCACVSIYYPTLYYKVKIQCKLCPNQCVCNINGCVSCSPGYNRGNNCACTDNYIQIDNKCQYCGNNFLTINGKCVCPSQSNKAFFIYLYYFDFDKNVCYKCPKNCVCDATGCNSCLLNTYRIISKNSKNKNLCLCGLNFIQNSNNVCQCSLPYVFDGSSNTCKCNQPFYLNANNQCKCKYYQNSALYYVYNDIETDCRACPPNCICGNIGCAYCSPSTGRAVLVTTFGGLICPCIPVVSNYTDSMCITCPSGYFISSNKCIVCDVSCLTCDQTGCTSCKNPLLLKNGFCNCSNDDASLRIYNYKGTCICMAGYYSIDSNPTNCISCPTNCFICSYISFAQSMPICLSCPQNAYRINDITTQCPCIPYYIQPLTIQSVCCHWSCLTCNLKGCSSCSAYSNRYLNNTDPNNITCSCKFGFIQSYQLKCICKPTTYLKYGTCVSCPFQCLNCQFVYNNINCSSCRPQTNTKLYSYLINNVRLYTCQCITNFTFLPNNDRYCYDKFCSTGNSGKCNSCSVNRILSLSNRCDCLPSNFQTRLLTCDNCAQGCLSCIELKRCTLCDVKRGYSLIINPITKFWICVIQKKENKILVTSVNNQFIFHIQIPTISIKNNLNNANIYIHIPNKNNISSQALTIKKSSILNQNTIQIITNTSINKYTFQIIIQINFQYINSNNSQSSSETYYNYNLPLYSYTFFDRHILWRIIIGFFIFASFLVNALLYIQGLKQNQIIFYLQTIYFLSFSLYDIDMIITPLLNLFSWSVFSFDSLLSKSPFDFLITEWDKYIELSSGNFRYYRYDSNCIRNIGLSLFISIANGLISILLRFIYSLLSKLDFNNPIRQYFQNNKKMTYRLIDWIHKITMYPNIFFAIFTIIHYSQFYTLNLEYIRLSSLSASVVIITAYLAQLIFFIIFQQTSRLSKSGKICQLFFDFITSAIISVTFYSSFVYFIPVAVGLRGMCYILIQKFFKRGQFSVQNRFKIYVILFEIVSLIMICQTNYISAAFLTFSTLVLSWIIRFFQWKRSKMQIKYIKKVQRYGISGKKQKQLIK